MHCRIRFRSLCLVFLFAALCSTAGLPVYGQVAKKGDAAGDASPRGSIVEDRAAKKLIEAGDARLDAEEVSKAVEIWKSVIERYPRSRVRFDAHMRLGNYFLDRERSYDRARTHFEAASGDDNGDDEQRAAATLKIGVCYYHARNFGKCFQVMRDVVEKFPVSPQVNESYYYIGLAHFQLGHYSRAITALEKVGTTLAGDSSQIKKLEAGKRFFIKIDDADLAVLDAGEAVDVHCKTSSGDEEVVKCYPVGRNVRLVLGSIPTRLGRPKPKNGTLEVKGGDSIKVTYVDGHTADKQLNHPVTYDVMVVGNAIVAVTDGAFNETLRGVVLDKTVNIRINDPDRDISDEADKIVAIVEVHRPKTDEEIEAELTAAKGDTGKALTISESEKANIERFRLVDSVKVNLVEAKVAVENEGPTTSPADACRSCQCGKRRRSQGGRQGTRRPGRSRGSRQFHSHRYLPRHGAAHQVGQDFGRGRHIASVAR